jgi:threonine dehydrogenase-like Zn-dependent dehydrogenase
MKALVLEEYNKLIYKDVADPVILPDEVLIRIKACGICGSDVHGLDGSTGRRIPPLIMGHEASGIIEVTGSAVKKWKTGDRVTFDSTVYQLDDWFTREGKYNLSDNREVMGVSPGDYRRNGAFAEFTSVPQHILYKIPDPVTFEQAAMVEAAAVAPHAVNISGMRAGDNCAVTGTGSIGIFVIKLLAISGAGRIIAIDNIPLKLKAAQGSGADNIFEPSEINLEEKIKAMTNSRGADISFEVAGKSETVNIAVDIVRKGGTVVLIGNTAKVIEFPLQKVVTKEIRVQGSCAIRGEYDVILKLLENKKLKVEDQISVVAPLSEGARWFRKLYMKEENLKKVILVP